MKKLFLAVMLLAVFGTMVWAQAVVPSPISGLPQLKETPGWAGGVSLIEANQATGRISFHVRSGICGYAYIVTIPCANTGIAHVRKVYGGGFVCPGYHAVNVDLKSSYAVLVVLTDAPLFVTKCSIWPWLWGSRQYPGELSIRWTRCLAAATRSLVCPAPCAPCQPCVTCHPCYPCVPSNPCCP